ncbi:MAG: DNA recombination protein RmuC [Lysobacteraceae bacterium]
MTRRPAMDSSATWVIALVAAAIGAALAWLPWRARWRAGQATQEDLRQRLAASEAAVASERKRSDSLSDERSSLAARAERVIATEAQLQHVRTELDTVRTAHGQADSKVAELQARLQEQQQAASDRLTELQNARERMKNEFQALASEILEDKSRRFGEQNIEQLGGILSPLREQIGDFRKLVADSYEKEGNARVALQTDLQGQLKRLLDLNLKLSDEASSLTRALTTDNRTQGYWGELKLERLLESAGLEKGQQYLTQESFRDADGDRYRPDAVLLLPEGRHIVVDAKMALLDYQRFCDATDDAAREQHLARHVAALRTHVRQLGDKDYSQLQGMNSPELVMMFVPVEAALLEALRRDSGIYDEAFGRKIVLVGPGNLLASLRLVAQMWRTEQQNRNAQLIAEKAGALYDKFVGFVDDLGKLGESLDRAQKLHQSALAKLSQGRGNLVRKVEELRRLGVAPSKRLPTKLLDASSADGLDEEIGTHVSAGDASEVQSDHENNHGAE